MKKILVFCVLVFVALLAGCSKQTANKPQTGTSEESSITLPVNDEPEEKPEVTPEIEVKPEIKPEPKPETKPAEKPSAEVTPKPKAEEPKSSAKPEPKPAVESAGVPALIDFGAENCIPCKMMKPVLEELSAEYRGKLKVTAYDKNKNEKLAKQYSVSMAPTLIFLDQNGKEIDRHVGFIAKDTILQRFGKHGITLEKE